MFFLKFAELLAFPSFCKLCSKLLEEKQEKVVCASCLNKLKPSCSPFCICCGRFFAGSVPSHICKQCLEQRPPYTLHRSCGRYDRELRDVLLLFKYREFRSLGRDLVLFLLNVLGEEHSLWWGLDVIVPVPLHPRRKRKRGFNQSEIMAVELAKITGIRCENRMLIKTSNRVPQTTLGAKKRWMNLRGAFQVRKKAGVREKKILLVDDVFTTGATMFECSKTLMRSGARAVSAVTLAQA